MGLLDTPETGVDVLRKALAARMKKRINFDWLEFPGGGRGEDNLRDFIAGADCLTLPELNILARDFYGKHTEVDPVTAMLKSNAPPPTPLGLGPGPYVRPANAYPPIVSGQEQMSLYPRDPNAESRPARLQAVGMVDDRAGRQARLATSGNAERPAEAEDFRLQLRHRDFDLAPEALRLGGGDA